jgi:hypothetical protein
MRKKKMMIHNQIKMTLKKINQRHSKKLISLKKCLQVREVVKQKVEIVFLEILKIKKKMMRKRVIMNYKIW